MRGGSAVPPGWDENPTAWSRRIAIAALAVAGFCVAGYLTLFQLGVLSSVWDPFFRSREVLELFRRGVENAPRARTEGGKVSVRPLPAFVLAEVPYA